MDAGETESATATATATATAPADAEPDVTIITKVAGPEPGIVLLVTATSRAFSCETRKAS